MRFLQKNKNGIIKKESETQREREKFTFFVPVYDSSHTAILTHTHPHTFSVGAKQAALASFTIFK